MRQFFRLLSVSLARVARSGLGVALRRGGWGYGSSLVVHATLVSVMAMVVWTRAPGCGPMHALWGEFSRVSDDALDVEPVRFEMPVVVASDISPDSASPAQPMTTAAMVRSPPTPAVPVIRAASEGTPAADKPAHPRPQKTATGREKSTRTAAGTKAGKGSGAGHSFFGVKAEGSKFVYVVDCSGSMNTPLSQTLVSAGSPNSLMMGQTRFERLRAELESSINALSPDMQFFIIFFSDNSIPMPASSMQAATGTNKQRFLGWVSKVAADGNTEPGDALQYALRLEPDAIYFLTDGVFNPKTAKRIERHNRQHVVIHTMAFGEKTGEKLLQEIAEQNGGTYRFVP